MPHLQLEHSANVPLQPQLPALLMALNQALVALEVAPLADIKSRAMAYNEFCIGDGSTQNAFVHLRVKLLSGRDASVLGRLSQACMKVLTDALGPDLDPLACQISVEVQEMERSTYIKQQGPLEETPPTGP